MLPDLDTHFPRYTDFDPAVPVWCVTPGEGRIFHRFFDTPPFSPSGRYMALFRMPDETRPVQPGDAGEVVLVDLKTGAEKVVATSRGWEAQMGANLNWGADDESLFFNDVDTDTWTPFIVRLNPLTGASRRLDGSIYHISPDGKTICSCCPLRMRRTQCGYGVVVPDDKVPRNKTLRDDDGLYFTDTETGVRRLVLSLKDVFEKATPKQDPAEYEGVEFYGFHSKWNAQGDRLIFTVRNYLREAGNIFSAMTTQGARLRFDVYTLRPDGTGIHTAVPAAQWDKGGHHINFFPDGEHLSMNLGFDGAGTGMRFTRVKYDGTDFRKFFHEPMGSGHPTIHPDGRHILTDAYPFEPVSAGDGTVPLRWVDRETGAETQLARIQAATPAQDAHVELRVDPHPAWDRSYRYFAFNGFAGGTRRVYVADMRKMLD